MNTNTSKKQEGFVLVWFVPNTAPLAVWARRATQAEQLSLFHYVWSAHSKNREGIS